MKKQALPLLLLFLFVCALAFARTTVNPPSVYCASMGDFPWEDWIVKIQVGNFQNTSGKSHYSDFTNQTIQLTQNTPTTVQLTTGFSYFTWDEYWRVWIDFNHDGIFSTPDEVVQQQILNAPAAGTQTASVTGSINIPTSALTGPARMRVSMKRGGFASACELFPFGEVEDYTVNIASGPAQLANLLIPSYEVIPGNGTCFTAPGQNFTHFGGLVLNNSAAAAGSFNVKGWFSKDQQLSANDVLWQTFSYSGVTPNSVVSWSFSNPVSAKLEPGLYYILVQADAENSVTELNETDNMLTIQVWIGAPDFTVSNVSGAPAATNAGGSFNLSVEAMNLVGFPLAELPGNLSTTVFLSADNQFSETGDVQIGTALFSFSQFSIPPLNVNGKATVASPVAISPSTAAGNYFIFIQLNGTCEQTINNNLSSAIPIQITSSGPANYCQSYSNFPWEDWIAKVEVGNFQNASGKSVYSDFTSQSINLAAGQSYPMNLTTGFSYFTWDEYWRVWIDFNKDGVFSTPDEVVQQKILTAPPAGSGTASVAASLNIPAWAPAGNTRMRVSMKRGAFASACEILPFGEVQDYTVNISGGSGSCSIAYTVSNIQCHDNGTPQDPSDDNFTYQILVTGGLGDGWHLNWNGGTTTGEYGVAKTVGPLLIAFYQQYGYNFMVSDMTQPTCSATGSVTPPQPCSTQPPPGNYCASQGDFPWHEWITRVKLNTLDNQSGKSMYSNFTALNTTLEKGQSYTITLTTGFSYFTWNEYWRVWIDWNHDGVFSTPNEVVQQQFLNAPANGTLSASIIGSVNIPQSALTGPTRMRVSMKRGAFASACESFANGEVEDYTLIISNNLLGNDIENRVENMAFEAVAGVSNVDLYGAYHRSEGVSEVIIEKSIDGENFQLLAMQAGEGSGILTATDEEPTEGFNYYRLLLKLSNGEMKVSPIRVISFEPVPSFTIFPNPAVSVIYLDLEKWVNKPVHIKLFDARGISVKNIRLDELQTPILNFPLDNIPSGCYFLLLETPGKRTVGKTVVVEREF